jgi:outer membrane protein assembly factor BamA
VSGVRAFNTGALRFKYEGDWIGIVGHHDLTVRGDFKAPVNVTNFFGLGNETVFTNNKKGDELFYRARYNFVDISMLMRRQLQSWMRINYGLGYQFFDVETKGNAGKYVSMAPQNGLDPSTLYKSKAFLGAHLKLDINSRNNNVVPTRGFTMDLNIRPLLGTTPASNNILKTDIDMRVYASLFDFPRFVLATRIGWGKNYGKFDFPQAYYLGGTENLRGYRRDRFGGRSMLFNNTEIRFRVANFSTYLFPGSVGLLVFNDVGRVWMDHETSDEWHVGNGVGIWVAPIRRFVVAAHLTHSKEDKAMPYVSFGFQF